MNMNMYNLKQGDKIRRINEPHGVLKVGEIVTFACYRSDNHASIYLLELNHRGSFALKNFELVKPSEHNEMKKIKTGDKVRRIGNTSGSMLKGGIYTVFDVNHKENEIELKELSHFTYYLHKFELVEDNTIPTKPFGQLKIKQKLELIEAQLRGQRLQYSADYSHSWVNFPLNTESKVMSFNDVYYYRLQSTETLAKIDEVQNQMVELTKQLDELKKSL